jgi:cytochrome c-type biogenesis protein CcmF
MRAPVVKSKVGFGFWSRETLLLINNIILVVATAMVLLGTLYPLILDSLTGAKLSVGPPYFNALFVPLMAILMLAMGVGVISRWKNTPTKWLIKMLAPVLLVAAVLAGLGSLLYRDFNIAVLGLFFICAWVLLASVRDILDKTRNKGLWRGMRSLTRSYWGMQLGHIGILICAIGVVLSSQYSDERDLKMAPGDALELGGYSFVFEGAEHHQGPNYTSDKASILVFEGEQQIARLRPEKRLYTVQQMPMTEAGIDPGFTRDLYVALGEPLENGAWAVRVHIKPFVRWIWLGALLTGLGGVLAAMDRRYRVKVTKKVKDTLSPREQGATADV